MSILHKNGSFSNVTASGLVLLHEGIGRHNGYNTENEGLEMHNGYNTENESLGRHNCYNAENGISSPNQRWNSFTLEDLFKQRFFKPK